MKNDPGQNAITHGCRARTHIIRGERQEDFDQLSNRWIAHYKPEEEVEAELVEKLILEKWLLLRNERRFAELEQKLSAFDFIDWTPEQHKEFQLALRYKTAAERSVARAAREVENYMSIRVRQMLDISAAEQRIAMSDRRLATQEAKAHKVIATIEKEFKDIDLSDLKAHLERFRIERAERFGPPPPTQPRA